MLKVSGFLDVFKIIFLSETVGANPSLKEILWSRPFNNQEKRVCKYLLAVAEDDEFINNDDEHFRVEDVDVKEAVGVVGPRAEVLRQECCYVSLRNNIKNSLHSYIMCNVQCIGIFC